MSSFGSCLPPFSSPRFFHTPLAPKPVCGSADFSVAARYNLRLRVRSRQLNSGELDVTPMYLRLRRRHPDLAAWRRDTLEHKQYYTIPLTACTRRGRTLTGQEELKLRSVFSKQECTTTVISLRTPMTHHTENPNHSSANHNQSSSTEVLANQLIGTCAR